ncbi:Hypothetical predicted protein [Paramuricea clavata]|uniref:Uncharacterized protein n=1 Tax=Paramuricea clavata TaxID=317549 RepID=A0A7D9L699_PARCT|nr:Hypothetical predicted protein [Paramuricea clavata]
MSASDIENTINDRFLDQTKEYSPLNDLDLQMLIDTSEDVSRVEWHGVPSGVPQGTKLRPWLFILMINNRRPCAPDYWKYIDVTIDDAIDDTDPSLSYQRTLQYSSAKSA